MDQEPAKAVDPFTEAFQDYMAYITKESKRLDDTYNDSVATLVLFMDTVKDETWKKSPTLVRPSLFDSENQTQIDDVALTLAPIIDLQVHAFDIPLLKKQEPELEEKAYPSAEVGLPTVNVTQIQPTAKGESVASKLGELPSKIVGRIKTRFEDDDPAAILGEMHKSKSTLDDLRQVPRIWNKYVKWHTRTMKRLDILERTIKDPLVLKTAYGNAQSEEIEFFGKLELQIMGGNMAYRSLKKKEFETTTGRLIVKSLDLMKAREERQLHDRQLR